MANQLLVSTEQLKTTSEHYRKYQAALEQTCAQMSGIADNTSTFWRGAANDAFLAGYRVLDGQLQKTSERMQDAVDELLKTAGIFEENETHIANEMCLLDVGTSPFRA